MPWSIKKSGDSWCVVADDTGEKVKCHPTREAALAHQRALYANVPDAKASRFTRSDRDTIDALLWLAVDTGNRHQGWEAAMAELIAEFDAQHPFGRARVHLEPAGRSYQVAVANTDETRARGMIGQTFGDGFEGMLFTYDTDVCHAFHMEGVTEQLYIVFFAADGSVVDHLGMFRQDPYHYRPQQAYRYALELPAVEGPGSNSDPAGAAFSGSPWSWLQGQTLHIEETH